MLPNKPPTVIASKDTPPGCKGVPQAQFNDCCRNGSPVYGPGCVAPPPNNQRPLGGCVSVQAEYYQQCVAQNAPACKGIPQAQFNDCCANGSPVYGPGCAAPQPNNQRPLGGCVSVQAEYYQQCVAQNAPGCKGIPQAQFNDCCPNGSPVYGPGCVAPQPRPLGGCVSVQAEYYEQCVAQNAPGCKGVPQAQFNDCCRNGSPVYGPGCAAPQPNNQRPLGGCVSVQAEYYQQCVAQNVGVRHLTILVSTAPGCKGIPQAQFNDCCPNGSPVYGPGCVAPPPNNQRPLGGCVSVQAEYYQQCVAQNGELINLVSKMAPDISTFSSRQPRNAKMSRKSNSMTAAATVLRYMVQAALRLHPIIKCRSEAARVFKKSTICNASLNLPGCSGVTLADYGKCCKWQGGKCQTKCMPNLLAPE
ncbi:hypothetical protein PSHT_05349 [Puccinia striiformis]|uniref:Uncharacterized protein n=1 Tax=Puccinia striiformis TaxID=27350 RepID=A0A2S4WAS4_9BASI|nr:hypothetical protein PSHT_05349 [Puccinia striiformis]